MVLKASLEKSTPNKHVAYLKQWMVYAKEIGSIKIHYVLHFLSVMFDTGVAYSTINSAKYVVTTILYIPT